MERLNGTIVKSTGSWYKVLTKDDKIFDCKIKGKFRLEGSKSTNPLAIGDKVSFHHDNKLNYSVIDELKERKNFLVRKSTNLSRQSHVIAANIDHTIIIVSLAYPSISSAFIDRYLVISKAYEIEPVIVINKIDLLNDEQMDEVRYLEALYTDLDYKCILTSAKTGGNIDDLKKIIEGKTCLFSGQSGVGKSAILNYIDPELGLNTREISGYTGKGQHTTSNYEMYRLGSDTFVIDSPGIRELGLYDFEAFEIGLFFPEFVAFAEDCKFNTCLHIDEPKCGVKEALENGKLEVTRYINYLKIMEDFNL